VGMQARISMPSSINLLKLTKRSKLTIPKVTAGNNPKLNTWIKTCSFHFFKAFIIIDESEGTFKL
jgi:hypothetical protein